MDTRKLAKIFAAQALERTGARHAIARARRLAAGGRRVVVLGYHRVCADFEVERTRAIESCLISRETFRRHVEFLSGRFELATMTRAVEVLTRRATATRDLAVITFDDGYRDVLENAVPILKEARAPAVMYVSSGVVERGAHFPHDRLFSLLVVWERSAEMRGHTAEFARTLLAEAQAKGAGGPRRWIYHLIRDRTPDELERVCDELQTAAESTALPPRSASALDWDGVRALQEAGFEIGAHTISHCVLTHLGRDAVEAQLATSKDAIERAIGRPVRHFAYCNGYYNRTTIDALRRTGYASAVTTEDRLNRLGDDPYRVARRVLWEGSARGPFGETSEAMLACLIDGTWRTLGFDASESGERPDPREEPWHEKPERRFA